MKVNNWRDTDSTCEDRIVYRDLSSQHNNNKYNNACTIVMNCSSTALFLCLFQYRHQNKRWFKMSPISVHELSFTSGMAREHTK